MNSLDIFSDIFLVRMKMAVINMTKIKLIQKTQKREYHLKTKEKRFKDKKIKKIYNKRKNKKRIYKKERQKMI